jgi:ectoine hydroxylase-related dioxygenase (phytanoyl-CoA dioxygenase family)
LPAPVPARFVTARSLPATLARDGFAVLRRGLSRAQIERLLPELAAAPSPSRRRGSVYGARNLLGLASVQATLVEPGLRATIAAVLGPNARCVRALFFDKTPDANWFVGWHQDRAIALVQQKALPGWGPWSIKAGVPHVLPPAEILARILTVRIALDACDAANGPLRTLAGSHRHGILDSDAITALRRSTPETLCLVPAGGIVALRPLTLHASSPAQTPGHRRVLHLEFAPPDLLPSGLHWHVETL